MTGKERLEIVLDKMARRGVTCIKPMLNAEAIKEKGLTEDQVCNDLAIMYEAIYNGNTRPARPFYDSYDWRRNVRSWFRYQWQCLLNPIRVWKIRRDNARAEKAAR